jgi:hypothetical protein
MDLEVMLSYQESQKVTLGSFLEVSHFKAMARLQEQSNGHTNDRWYKVSHA